MDGGAKTELLGFRFFVSHFPPLEPAFLTSAGVFLMPSPSFTSCLLFLISPSDKTPLLSFVIFVVFSLVHFLACHRIFFRCLPSEFAKRTFRDKRFVQCLEVVARIERSHFLLGANGTQRFIIQVRPRGWQEAWVSWFFSEGLTYHIGKKPWKQWLRYWGCHCWFLQHTWYMYT